MADTSVAPFLNIPEQSISTCPRRALTYVTVLVALATGWFAALHLLGTLNILFGHPAIAPGTVLIASVAGLCVPLFLLRRVALTEGLEACPQDAPLPRAVKAVAALAAVPYTVLLLNSFWSFPNGTDALQYHINLALRWLQDGTIRLDPSLGWQYSLPGNAELPAMLALSVHLEKAVAAGNLFAGTLLAVAVYLIAWKIVRQTAPSLLSAVVVCTIPIVIYQTFELYVDLFGAAFLTGAVALMVWRKKNPPLCIFLSGCAAGIAVGSKPVFWVYGAMYAMVALATVLRGDGKRLKRAALLTAGIAMTSGFWFFRAGVATGNPLYPIRLPFAHHAQTSGVKLDTMMHMTFQYGFRALFSVVTYPWTEHPHDYGLPVGSDRGTGPLFAAIAVPGIAFLLVRTWRRRIRSEQTVLLVATVAAWMVWTVQMRITRFGLPVMALSCALAAPMLSELLDKSRRVLIFLCLAGVVISGLYCSVGPVQRLARRFRGHDWSRAAYYGYPRLLDRLPPGSRILNWNPPPWDFILVGAGLTNSVRYYVGNRSNADYVLMAGPRDPEEDALTASGAILIYNDTPPNLFPNIAVSWRIYKVSGERPRNGNGR